MKLPKFTDFDSNRKLFFDSFDGAKTIQTLPDNKKKKPKFNITKIVQLPGGVYPDAEIPKGYLYDRTTWIPFNYIHRLEQFNDAGACISLTINETNGKGRKKEDIIKVRACYADFDDTPMPNKFKLEPSMIIETSKDNFHVYWFVEKFPLEMFEQTQSAISYNLNSDPAVKDISRALRIPGFYHMKKNPFLSRIIAYTGLKYSVSDFECFPPKPVKQFSSDKYRTMPSENSEYKGEYGVSKGGRNHHLAKVAGGMLKNGRSMPYIESELFKEGRACSPPLSDYEITGVVKSIQRYK